MSTILVAGNLVCDNPVYPGARAACQAYVAGRLGDEKVVMLGAAGSGDAAARVIADLQSAGVDTAAVLTDGSPCSVEYFKANHAALEKSDIVLCQTEMPKDVVEYLVEEAYKLCKTIILNVAPAPQDGFSDATLHKVNYITLNEDALTALSGYECKNVEQCTRGAGMLVKRGANNVIVTVGRNGAVMVYPDGDASYPADLIVMRDPFMAGNCFTGALAGQLGWGKNINNAIEFAVQAATLTCQKEGALESIPRKDQIRLF